MANKSEVPVEKANGRVYTPSFIVKNILDLSGYCGGNILHKHVMDNSCGDGAFLVEIVDRYCKMAIKQGLSKPIIAKELSEYIHGIEVDGNEHKKCLKNVNCIAQKYEIIDVDWDIICADTLKINKYQGKMDFVLGNPPYIRVHNLGKAFDNVKRFTFAQSGMTDLYIVFYEIGLSMLKSDGVLGYITPSSYFNSVAGVYMRKYLVQENLLDKIVNLKHFQAFNSMTYTTITILKKLRTEKTTKYYEFDEKNLMPIFVDTLTPEDYYISNNFYFSKRENLALLKKIFFNLGHCDIQVKNGYATLCDSVFIKTFEFNSKYIIPIIKASKGQWAQAFYPYDQNGKLIKEEVLKDDRDLYDYLLGQREKLLNRSCDNKHNGWYAFGRSQAINDTFKDKVAINTLLKTSNDVKLTMSPSGSGVYSGLYLISKTFDIEEIKKVLKTQEFVEYVSLLGKYKSGGYYTFSSKDLKAFLDYKFAYNDGADKSKINEEFIEAIRKSFNKYLSVGTSRSTAKLKTLHGHIAKDLERMLGKDFTIISQGYGDDKESIIEGRYYPKNVDIAVQKDGRTVAGYAVKFVMRNYSQNSNNYFENMLGETANIRSNSIPYFQIFIIFEKVPYYSKGGEFKKYDVISEHNLDKYLALSKDDPNIFYHTPDKTLVVLIKLKEKSPDHQFSNSLDYNNYYQSVINDQDLMLYSDKIIDAFDDSVILNNYEDFLNRTYHIIMGRLKN